MRVALFASDMAEADEWEATNGKPHVVLTPRSLNGARGMTVDAIAVTATALGSPKWTEALESILPALLGSHLHDR